MVFFEYKKGQSSVEFLILMGFLTFVIIGILAVGYSYSGTISDNIRSNQINNFANKIISTSETVFYAGEPSKATISVNIPDNVQDVEIVDNSVVVTYRLTSGENKVSFSSNVPIIENLSAEISSGSGLKNLIVIANLTHAVISQN